MFFVKIVGAYVTSNWQRMHSLLVCYLVINNGNRTEWSPIRSVVVRVINKIGRGGSPICQSRVWLQTELDDTKSSYQLINHNHYNFGKKIHLGQTFPVGTMSKGKKLEITQFSFQGKWLLL